jgi:hypothetical protein
MPKDTLAFPSKSATSSNRMKQYHKRAEDNYYLNYQRRHRPKQKEYRRRNRARLARWGERYRAMLKLDALTYYGKNGRLQCCWHNCDETDVDVLTLDHINDDGGRGRRDREHGSGHKIYNWLRTENYPDGYQTLCANHQMKKEILKQRRAAKGYELLMRHLEAVD